MSKHNNHHQSQPRESLPQVPRVPQPGEAFAVEDTIEIWRRCPLCWNGHSGYGVAYSTQGNVRYYRCVKTLSEAHGPCGHTWTAQLDQKTLGVVSVTHRTVTLTER